MMAYQRICPYLMGNVLIPHAWVIGQRQNYRPLCVGEGPCLKAVFPGIEGGAQCLGCTAPHQGLRFANMKRHSVHYIFQQPNNLGVGFHWPKIFKIWRPELLKGKESPLRIALCMGRRTSCSLEWGLEELSQKLQGPCCM
jgi:hypothetical protein